nr:hypothetical protein [Rhodococcus sp. 06-1059B-a]
MQPQLATVDDQAGHRSVAGVEVHAATTTRDTVELVIGQQLVATAIPDCETGPNTS